MKLLLFLLFIAGSLGNYTVHLTACKDTDCIMDKPRMGQAFEDDCNPTAIDADLCGETVKGIHIFTRSRVCVASLDDLWFNHVQAYTHAPENNTCSDLHQTIKIIATDRCEENTTFTTDVSNIYINQYDNNACTSTPTNTYTYSLDTCIDPSTSIYQIPVLFHYSAASTRRRVNRKIKRR